jgi:hypothetical protein
MSHTCNPSIREDEEEDYEFQASLGYVARLSFKNQLKKLKEKKEKKEKNKANLVVTHYLESINVDIG